MGLFVRGVAVGKQTGAERGNESIRDKFGRVLSKRLTLEVHAVQETKDPVQRRPWGRCALQQLQKRRRRYVPLPPCKSSPRPRSPVSSSSFPDTAQVSSEETRLRNESNEFTYDLGSARAYSTRGTAPPLGAVGAQYSPEGVQAVAPSDMLPYRNGGSAYNYAAKGYYGPVTWSPHGYEDGVDYGLQ